MTQTGNKPKGPARELLLLVLIILVGLPVAWKWGARDGRALAEKAYGGEAASGADDADDYDDYDDDDEDDSGAAGAVPESSPEAIARGEALFKANCAACHGEKGDGKGPAAMAFTPPPRNFTDPAARWTKGREPGQVFATISNGVEGTGMAGFAGALSEAQRWDLVHYIASLSGKDGP